MTNGPGVGAGLDGIPVSRGEARPQQRPFATAIQSLNATIYATPGAELEAKLEQLAQTYPYLFIEMSPVATTSVEPTLDEIEDIADEEDEGAEVQGQDGNSYTEDVDPSSVEEENLSHGGLRRGADLRIRESGPPHARRFEVEIGDLLTSLPAVGGGRTRLPPHIMETIEERAAHLLDVGNLIIGRQRAFFTAASGDAAFVLLEPLTKTEAARLLGFREEGQTAETLRTSSRFLRLIEKKIVETPRFGLVPLDLFFRGARARGARTPKSRRLRPDVLASHIRAIMEENPRPKWTEPRMRKELEKRRILDETPADAIEAANKRVGRAMKLIRR